MNVLPPTNGDTPLDQSYLDQLKSSWQNERGGGDIHQQVFAMQDFYNQFGRYPTRAELSSISPNYAGDPNLTNSGLGRQAVGQYYQDQINDPINRKKTDESNAGQYSGKVNEIFNQLLKHGASDAEVQHFGGLLASGQVDPYELQQFIMQTPEYQTNQDTAFRSSLNDELTNEDTKAFGRQKEDVISRFASAGRIGSTALDFALTDLMGKVAEKRQGFLANLSAAQYGSSKDSARADYGNLLNGMKDTTSYERTLADINRQRGWNVSDYNRQKDDYMAALKSQQRPWWQSALPGITQGVLGAGGQLGAAAILA